MKTLASVLCLMLLFFLWQPQWIGAAAGDLDATFDFDGKANARSEIFPGVFYDVKVTFDGNNFTLVVNGAQLAIMRASAAPNGTVGFRVKNTTGRFAFITVN